MSSVARGCTKNFTAILISSSLLEVSTQAQRVVGPFGRTECWPWLWRSSRWWPPKRKLCSVSMRSCRFSRSVYSMSRMSGFIETSPCWQTMPRMSLCHSEAKTMRGTRPPSREAPSRKRSQTRPRAASSCSAVSEMRCSDSKRLRSTLFRSVPSSANQASYMASTCWGLVSKGAERWKRCSRLPECVSSSAGRQLAARSGTSEQAMFSSKLRQNSNSSCTTIVDIHLAVESMSHGGGRFTASRWCSFAGSTACGSMRSLGRAGTPSL
mmetsp:Transcript_97355/g.303639  ORF Transcript_97355/g.303639 Transcript_97355/m.303639 type:complete len:267 (-) Transcript_97355:126-926(-)